MSTSGDECSADAERGADVGRKTDAGRKAEARATKVGVLVVDDSPLMQRIITRLLESDPQIRVVDTAGDGLEAVEKVADLRPDVVTLDIQMPRLDGLSALRRIMSATPTPVVMLSALGEAEMVMAALQSGAVDFVTKPSGTVSVDLYKVRSELVQKVKVATFTRPRNTKREPVVSVVRQPSVDLQGSLCVVIGASTGGPGAISQILRRLPGDFAGSVLVVQHMPIGFTRSFAERLDRDSGLRVVEAAAGLEVAHGSVYVAPGGVHMVLTRPEGARKADPPIISLLDSPPVNSVRPSIDVLMASVAELCGSDAIGVLLSGMGTDGAEGLRRMQAAGAATIVQDRESSTIFGMPRAAVRLGAADQVLPVSEIADAVMALFEKKARKHV